MKDFGRICNIEELTLFKQMTQVKGFINESRKDFQELIKDKEIPLYRRWKWFETFGGLMLEINPETMELEVLYAIDLFNDLEIRRSETWTFPNLLELINDLRHDFNIDNEENEFTDLNLDELREEMLTTGFYGFIFDW